MIRATHPASEYRASDAVWDSNGRLAPFPLPRETGDSAFRPWLRTVLVHNDIRQQGAISPVLMHIGPTPTDLHRFGEWTTGLTSSGNTSSMEGYTITQPVPDCISQASRRSKRIRSPR